MASSPVEICNSALARVGSDRITSLSDENARAKVVNEQYDNIRKAMLRAHPWNFAIKRIEIANLVDEPLFEFNEYYQLPNDCLRVLDIEDKSAEWRVEGRKLATNATSPIYIRYIADIEDTSQFDPHFDEALAATLAANISYVLNQSITLRESLMKEAANAVAQARSYNAQESSGATVEAGTFRDVRS